MSSRGHICLRCGQYSRRPRQHHQHLKGHRVILYGPLWVSWGLAPRDYRPSILAMNYANA